MPTGEDDVEVLLRDHPELCLEENRGCLESAVGGRRGESQRTAAQILHALDPTLAMGQQLHLVPEAAVGARHHGQRMEARAVHGERHTPGVESRHMQTAGPHRLDLRGVRLNGEEQDLTSR